MAKAKSEGDAIIEAIESLREAYEDMTLSTLEERRAFNNILHNAKGALRYHRSAATRAKKHAAQNGGAK